MLFAFLAVTALKALHEVCTRRTRSACYRLRICLCSFETDSALVAFGMVANISCDMWRGVRIKVHGYVADVSIGAQQAVLDIVVHR